MEICRFLFHVAVMLLFSTSLTNGQQLQSLNIWMAPSCDGPSAINATQNGNHSIFPGYPNHYRANGLWTIEICRTAVGTCRSWHVAQGTNVGCVYLPFLKQVSIDHLRLTRYGDANQNEATITFYSETSFRGLSQVVGTDGGNLTFAARSYFFTGVNQWTHGKNSTRNGTCLPVSPEVVNQGYGHTFQTNVILQIGSVVHNCPNQPIPTTSTPTPSTSITTTSSTQRLPSTTTSATQTPPNSTPSTMPPTPTTSLTTTRLTTTQPIISTQSAGTVTICPTTIVLIISICSIFKISKLN